MTALLIIVAAIVLLLSGYVFYGSWLAKQWGIDPARKTPAVQDADGVDYVSAKPAVLMGHHYSSIAGAGPINGPIQAAVFGWTSALSLPLSVTTASPSAKSSRTQWARPQRSCSLYSPSWC